jgi:hypothetical protein
MEIFRRGKISLSDDSTCHQLSIRICVEAETQTNQRARETWRKVTEETSLDFYISHKVRSARRTYCPTGNINL